MFDNSPTFFFVFSLTLRLFCALRLFADMAVN